MHKQQQAVRNGHVTCTAMPLTRPGLYGSVSSYLLYTALCCIDALQANPGSRWLCMIRCGLDGSVRRQRHEKDTVFAVIPVAVPADAFAGHTVQW